MLLKITIRPSMILLCAKQIFADLLLKILFFPFRDINTNTKNNANKKSLKKSQR